MDKNINAEIIAIGTEILLGEITDTNSVYLAQKLRSIGISVYYMTSVGDNEKRITSAIQSALARADIVITCGGLGPTVDDMTRQAVAMATGRGLTFHQHLLDQIAARFAGFRAPMTENNRRQAFLPERSIVVENPVGTAPSFIVEHDDKLVMSLPGVPREMKFLFENAMMPFLRDRFGLSIIKAKILKTAGIGESMLDDALGNDLLEASNPTIGLAAHAGQVDIRITAKAVDEASADLMIADFEAKVRDRVGAYVFGVDKDTLEAALANILSTNGQQVAILEAGLPPSLSMRMERIGTALVFRADHLDGPGAVQKLLADKLPADAGMRLLAETAARHMAGLASNAVGIAIIARPDVKDDRADKEEGSAFAVCVNDSVRSRAYGFGGASEDAHRWSTTWALSAAWQMLHQQRG